MKQIVINLVIEGHNEDINTIKGNIIREASEALLHCSAYELKEAKPKKDSHSKAQEIAKFLNGEEIEEPRKVTSLDELLYWF